jgi:hypothetical protein
MIKFPEEKRSELETTVFFRRELEARDRKPHGENNGEPEPIAKPSEPVICFNPRAARHVELEFLMPL